METKLVASDIHGSVYALEKLLSRCEEHQASELLLAGDIGMQSLHTLFSCLPIPTILVRGNCDNAYDFSSFILPPLVQRFPLFGRQVVMTHGDRYPTPNGFDMHKDDIFIFGHIHQSRLYRDKEGIIILNPGSAAFPRGNDHTSYALITERGISIQNLENDQKIQFLSLNRV
ncbi:MAG: YfcE family phosphodiesterase [Sphaerochaetaceae bacterium]